MSLPTIGYGINARPSFKDDGELIANLSSEHVPSASSSAKRLVIVGDVHGQLASLKALLNKVSFDKEKGDHLVLAGDLVTRGPDSAGVVQLAMDLGASAVRGNQEDKVILFSGPYNNNKNTKHTKHTGQDDHARAVGKELSAAQLEWLKSLPVMLRIPKIGSDTTPAPWNANEIVVAHGGLVPGLPLERQDPWGVMNMRTVTYPADEIRRKRVKERLKKWAELRRLEDHIGKTDKQRNKSKIEVSDDDVNSEVERLRIEWSTSMRLPATATSRAASLFDPLPNEQDKICLPSDKREGEPWAEAYSRAQNSILDAVDRRVVIYGHDAKAGLQVSPMIDYHTEGQFTRRKKNVMSEDVLMEKGTRYAFGLDSGCGHGRKLSAMVIELGSDGIVKTTVADTECSAPSAKVDEDA